VTLAKPKPDRKHPSSLTASPIIDLRCHSAYDAMRQQLIRALRTCPDATPGPSRVPLRVTAQASARPRSRSTRNLDFEGQSTRQIRRYTSSALSRPHITDQSRKAYTSSSTSASFSSSSSSNSDINNNTVGIRPQASRSPASAHPHPAFKLLTSQLSATQPCFGARGDEVRLIAGPGEFYKDLIEMLKRAKRRVIISSLYIGAEEAELVSGSCALLSGLAPRHLSFPGLPPSP
jgi:hypothetical protein